MCTYLYLDFNSAGLHGAHDAVLGLYMAATNPAGVPGGAGGLEQQSRTKRVRTSFKNHQLRVLKQYFQLNHNPDAKELKQLSQKTGLSKRVLQVGPTHSSFSSILSHRCEVLLA